MQLPRITTSIAAAALMSAPSALAQSQLASYEGTQVGQSFMAVDGGYDLNGDGFDDLVVGSTDPSAGFLAGQVQAISGATGNVIWSNSGIAGSQLGEAICLIPDLSGDGIRDVLVGAPGGVGSAGPGEIFVYSGATGSLVLTRTGFQAQSELGSSVAGDFDWDQDGVADFAAGGPYYDGANTDQGYIAVYSGLTGATLAFAFGSADGGHFGSAMAGGGDFDGDGFNDLAVGEPDAGQGGIVSFLPGTAQIQPIFINARYGASLVCLGDVSADGQADWLVGAPGRSGGAGGALIFGDNIGIHVSLGSGSDELGTDVANLGDVDGDGVNDMAVSATQGTATGPGYVRVISGKFQTQLWERTGEFPVNVFGWGIAGVGDHNGDGYPDLAVGSPRFSGALTNQGRVEVFSGGGPGFVNYCTAGKSASECVASISGAGTPSAVLGLPFVLSASGVEGGKRGLFFYGWNGRQANAWGASTSFNCVMPPVRRTPLQDESGTPGNCDGQFSVDLNAYWQANPNKNPGAGAVTQAQLWYRDPANTTGEPTSMSNALEFVVGP